MINASSWLRKLTFCAIALAACGDDASSDGDKAEQMSPASTPDAGDEIETHAIEVSGKLASDEQGAAFISQNGATVYVPAASLVGKQVIWLVTEGGEIPPNAKFLDLGMTTIGEDLSFAFKTKDGFADGPWELTTFVLVEGTDFTKGPQMGDLAAYTPLETEVPKGDPEVTGVTVRVRVEGRDAQVELNNSHFVRF